MTHSIAESIRDYYGRVLQSSRDLKTSACCLGDSMPGHLRPLIRDIHPQILERFYGCGSPLPPGLEGTTVLDLGCGTGRDCYLLSRLVGPQGRVIGVDMTPEQLDIARLHRAWHAERYGHAQSNVEFLEGYVEDLAAAGIEDGSIDVVVSNCVLNLSAEKHRVFAEILRVLKPGGELYFSDVFADRRIPEHLARDPVLLGECLGGALYWEDFRRLMGALGCADLRVVEEHPVSIDDPELKARIGMVAFRSVTVRAFRLELEDRCEDYGQVACYRGGIPEAPHVFELDDHHRFEAGRPQSVCGNTADMLSRTRYGRHFEVLGDRSRHFGLFPCAPGAAATKAAEPAGCC